jgi:hypothetical protein
MNPQLMVSVSQRYDRESRIRILVRLSLTYSIYGGN